MGCVHTRWLTISLGVLAGISVLVAALVVFTSGPEAQPAKEPRAAVTIDDSALLVGDAADAPFDVVVHEDFGCTECRAFDLASRDFLRIEAARDDVRVAYRPVHALPTAYSRTGLGAYLAATSAGTPQRVLAFHDEIFDRQPLAGQTVPGPEVLAGWAAKLGLDGSAVGQGATAPGPAASAAVRDQARRDGVTGLPTVLLNGTQVTGTSGIALADRLQASIVDGIG